MNTARELESNTIATIADYARVGANVARIERAEADKMALLTPPASLADDWRQVISTTRSIATNMAEGAGYAQSNNTAEARHYLFAASPDFKRLYTIFEHDQIRGCEEKDSKVSSAG